MLEIIAYPHETLLKHAEPVQEIDDSIRSLVSELGDAMHQADGIGLAAPQVDVSLRIFIVQSKEMETYQTFINPSIIQSSQETCVMREGCLSILNTYADVRRSSSISIQAQNEQGEGFVLHVDGMYARIIQHEMDHLNGALFVDYLDDELREKLLLQYNKQQENRKKST